MLCDLCCWEIIFTYVGSEVFTTVVLKSIIFWNMTLCSPLSFSRCFGGTYRLHLQGRRNRFSNPASKQVASCKVLKMVAISSSKTAAETQRTTWRHIPEDDTLQFLRKPRTNKQEVVSTHMYFKSVGLWDVTLCSLVDSFLCFGGTCSCWRWRQQVPLKCRYLHKMTFL
jgi:hypothetical protein